MKTAIDIKAKKILIVEDDKDINNLIDYNLSKSGYKTECVFDGVSAQEKLVTEFFDVVILDVMLPGLNGFKICEFIKQNPEISQTFVLMVTARAQPLDKIYGDTLGADYYMTKPFSVKELIKVIDESYYQKKELKQSI